MTLQNSRFSNPFLRSKKKDLIGSILPYIIDGSFDTPAKLDAAIKYSEKSAFDKNEFVESCGVGVKISGEDIENAVSKAIKVSKSVYHYNEKKLSILALNQFFSQLQECHTFMHCSSYQQNLF